MAEAVARSPAPSPSSRTSICSSSGAVADGHVGVAGARVLERVGQALLHDPVGGEVDRRAGAGRARPRRAARTGRPARPTSSSSASRPSRPGWGASSSSSPSRRIAPSRRRISASAVRPVCSTPCERLAVVGRASSGSLCRTAPTWSTITLTAWATMSWSSRAIRARSSATAMRAAASRSRSAWVARSSAASACSARSRSAKPASQPIANRTGMKMSSPAAWLGLVVDDDRRAADARSPGPAAPAARRGGCRAGTRPPCPATKTPTVNDDQPPVDERERRGQQPDGRGRGEGEAPPAEQRQHDAARSPGRRTRASSCGALGASCRRRPRARSRAPRARSARRIRTCARGCQSRLTR